MSKGLHEMHKGKPAGMFFVLTYFGALFYFVDKASGFWEVIYSFFQALVWPAILIYKVFTVLQI